MSDPKIVLLGLMEEHWGLDFTPRFSSDWYQGQVRLPKVTVSRVLTSVERLGFTESPEVADRKQFTSLSVDVWSRGEETRRWRMVKEVDRILREHGDHPGGGLDYLESKGWRDLDEGTRRPRIYRSRVNVEAFSIG